MRQELLDCGDLFAWVYYQVSVNLFPVRNEAMYRTNDYCSTEIARVKHMLDQERTDVRRAVKYGQ